MLSYTIQKLSVFPITCTPSLQRMYTYYKQNFSAFQPFFYNQSDNLVDLFFKYRTSCTTAIIISVSSDFITMLSVSLAYSFRLHMPIHHIYSCKIYQIFVDNGCNLWEFIFKVRNRTNLYHVQAPLKRKKMIPNRIIMVRLLKFWPQSFYYDYMHVNQLLSPHNDWQYWHTYHWVLRQSCDKKYTWYRHPQINLQIHQPSFFPFPVVHFLE